MYCFVCVGREQLATARSRLASFVYVLLRWTMCAKVNRLVFLPHLNLQMPLGQIVKKKKIKETQKPLLTPSTRHAFQLFAVAALKSFES